MEDPNDKRFRIEVTIFSVLMVGVLLSVIALYAFARPSVQDLGPLNFFLVLSIIFASAAFAMAVKSGIPPKPPKRERIIPETPKPTAGIKSGIPPSPRKTNG